jgi:hypothetical protein
MIFLLEVIFLVILLVVVVIIVSFIIDYVSKKRLETDQALKEALNSNSKLAIENFLLLYEDKLKKRVVDALKCRVAEFTILEHNQLQNEELIEQAKRKKNETY